MKNVLLFFTAIMLVSCNDQLDRSIFEPLTVNELKEAIDQDLLFKNTYEYITFVRDSFLESDMEKVKFADLTYERILEFARYSSDTAYFKPINERIKKEWNESYGIYLKKADSISSYWKKYRDENSLSQYVTIELVRIDKEYFSYSGGIRNVNLGFKLTPLKGKIDQLRFGYRIGAKINEKEDKDEDVFSSIYSVLDFSWCLMTTPFSKPIVRYWEANYSNENILKSKTLETFKRDYNIYIKVDEIRKDGVNISEDDLDIPESVLNHWEYENREFLNDLYVDDIIEEVLGKEYISENKFRSQEIDKILKEKDSLVFEFIRAPMKRNEID